MRPISWLAIGVSVTALGLAARALAGRRVHTVEPREEEPAPEPPKRAPVFAPPPPVTRARPSTALAHLRGRVIGPAGVKVELDDLTVKADDGERDYEADTTPDGRFQLHVPARAYTVTAWAGDLVGVVTARTRPGAEEEVTIRLQPDVAIEVEVDLGKCVDTDLQATVTRAGSAVDIGRATQDEHGFRIPRLIRGAVYDLTVSDAGRKTVVRGVTAPATVSVTLPEPVTLRGGIGFAAGTKCPFRRLSLVDDDGDDGRTFKVDAHCRFEVGELEVGATVHLRASAPGWHLDEYVTLPANGEPELACLNPPCRDLPPVIPAELEVILTGAPAGAGISVQFRTEEARSGCGGDGERCEIEDLAPDTQGFVVVHSRDCGEVRQPVSLVSGHNTVTVACRRMRLIEGIVRGRDRSKPGVVSCKDGGEADLTDSSVFELRCPEGTSEITYRTGPHKVQATAPIPPGDPAFVELTL